jgi:XTP/dITP diphosphohydrolase
MKQLIFATHKKNKVFEAKAILKNKIEVISLDEINFFEDIAETGATFEENASIKANYISQRFNLPCFADDSGLEVEALNGAPGLYSARYAGSPKNDDNNNTLLLSQLEHKNDRNARFITVIALHLLGEDLHYFEGIINGAITRALKGSGGFGYDPLFQPDGYNQTFAELDESIKNNLSHRALAIKKMSDFLENRSY